MRNYKLSTAIRKGVGLTCKNGDFFHRGKLCALGGAYKATYGLPFPSQDEIIKRLFASWPELSEFQMWVDVPKCIDRGTVPVLIEIIGELNDKHKWTRDKVADWVESLGY